MHTFLVVYSPQYSHFIFRHVILQTKIYLNIIVHYHLLLNLNQALLPSSILAVVALPIFLLTTPNSEAPLSVACPSINIDNLVINLNSTLSTSIISYAESNYMRKGPSMSEQLTT